MINSRNKLLGAVLPLMMCTAPAHSQIIDIDLDLGDLLGLGLCIGSGCDPDFESPDDELTLSGPILSILFDDTSDSPDPSNDWRIEINDDNGPGEDYFAIADVTGGQQPFRIMGGAPGNALVLDDTGHLGLGTQFPLREIHLAASDTPGIRLEQTAGVRAAQIWEVVANEANFMVSDVTNATMPFMIEASAPDDGLVIDAQGKVGFGVSAPEEQLHIRSNAADTDAFALFDANGSGSDSAFRLRQNGTVPTTWEFRNQQSSGRLNVGIAGGNTPLKIEDTAVNNLLKLGRNNRPDEVVVTGKLVVNDVQLSVPDYVFADEYVLRPLAEVQAFIDTNSHLPEVPSEADIKANGVNMTEMQMTLLKKVEELTLYTIEQEELIATQRAQFGERIARLEALLAD